MKKNSSVVKEINKNDRESPKVIAIVCNISKGKKEDIAVREREFSRKRISKDVSKTVKSAISNAENNHQLDIDKLYVKEATVGKSMVLTRFRPRARGRAGKILKPFSRIKIQLTEKNSEEKAVQSKKEPNQEKVENGTKN